jgi:hypothetical protein
VDKPAAMTIPSASSSDVNEPTTPLNTNQSASPLNGTPLSDPGPRFAAELASMIDSAVGMSSKKRKPSVDVVTAPKKARLAIFEEEGWEIQNHGCRYYKLLADAICVACAGVKKYSDTRTIRDNCRFINFRWIKVEEEHGTCQVFFHGKSAEWEENGVFEYNSWVPSPTASHKQIIQVSSVLQALSSHSFLHSMQRRKRYCRNSRSNWSMRNLPIFEPSQKISNIFAVRLTVSSLLNFNFSSTCADSCSVNLFFECWCCLSCGFELCGSCHAELPVLVDGPTPCVSSAHGKTSLSPVTFFSVKELQDEISALEQALSSPPPPEHHSDLQFPVSESVGHIEGADMQEMPKYRLKDFTEEMFSHKWNNSEPFVLTGVVDPMTPTELLDLERGGQRQCTISSFNGHEWQNTKSTLGEYFSSWDEPQPHRPMQIRVCFSKFFFVCRVSFRSLKDYPPNCDLHKIHPKLHRIFLRCIEQMFGVYMAPRGPLNMFSYFPKGSLLPDLGMMLSVCV